MFDLLNAIGARECGAAFAQLDHLLADGEQIIGIHAMVVRHLRTLVSARALLDRGDGSAAAERELGLQSWQARSAIEQARRYSAAELSRALRSAAELERALKSGRNEPRVALELWLASLCGDRDWTGNA